MEYDQAMNDIQSTDSELNTYLDRQRKLLGCKVSVGTLNLRILVSELCICEESSVTVVCAVRFRSWQLLLWYHSSIHKSSNYGHTNIIVLELCFCITAF